MFDTIASPRAALGAAAITEWVRELSHLDESINDVERIDRLSVLEELKAAAAAAQAVTTASFDASQRAQQEAAGIRHRDLGKGVAAQVALARRESPHRGDRHLGLAKAVVHEMPYTLAAMRSGRLSEWRATLMVRETACLDSADRRRVDAELARDVDALERYGDRQLVAEARKISYRLDPHSFVARAAKANSDRNVTVRPAPDTMSYLTALLPVAQGVAVFATLGRHADSCRAAGDLRSRGQIMADTLVERVTGQAAATGTPVAVGLVMSDLTLLGGSTEPAHLDGYGTIPAGIAGRLVIEADQAWLRRLYADPVSGELAAIDSVARRFPDGLDRLIRARDQVCRTPWCDAPIRHDDHVQEHASGGETSLANGQGLCERCNHIKQTVGWRARPRPGPCHVVDTTTPTGHTYTSCAPAPPGNARSHWTQERPGLWSRIAA